LGRILIKKISYLFNGKHHDIELAGVRIGLKEREYLKMKINHDNQENR